MSYLFIHRTIVLLVKKSVIDSYFEDETTIDNWIDESDGNISQCRVMKWLHPVDKPTDPFNTQAPTPLDEGFGYLQLIRKKTNMFAVAKLRSKKGAHGAAEYAYVQRRQPQRGCAAPRGIGIGINNKLMEITICLLYYFVSQYQTIQT